MARVSEIQNQCTRSTYRTQPSCYFIKCPVLRIQSLLATICYLCQFVYTSGGISLCGENITAPNGNGCHCSYHSCKACLINQIRLSGLLQVIYQVIDSIKYQRSSNLKDTCIHVGRTLEFNARSKGVGILKSDVMNFCRSQRVYQVDFKLPSVGK